MQEDPAKEEELQPAWQEKNTWYSRAVSYWDNQAATVDGVLGGFGHVSPADIRESERFLLKASRSMSFEGIKHVLRVRRRCTRGAAVIRSAAHVGRSMPLRAAGAMRLHVLAWQKAIKRKHRLEPCSMGVSQCFRQRLKAAAAGEQLVALDCGSGVGRIAEQLLLQHFQEVRGTSSKL